MTPAEVIRKVTVADIEAVLDLIEELFEALVPSHPSTDERKREDARNIVCRARVPTSFSRSLTERPLELSR